jgi:hypothetical protein
MSIRFQGELTPRLRRRALRLALRGVLPAWVLATLVGGALALGLGLLLRGYPVGGAFFFSVGLLGLLILGLYALVSHRVQEPHETLIEPFEGELDEDGLVASSASGSARFGWPEFRRWKSSSTVLLLYQTSHRFLVLAADHFADDQAWRSARSLVARKVPSTQSGDRRRLVVVFFLFFVLTVVAAVVWSYLRG